MGIIFLACMYLLFGGGSEQEQTQVGINEAIPQATETLLPSDKEKAYEEALLEEKEADKKLSQSRCLIIGRKMKARNILKLSKRKKNPLHVIARLPLMPLSVLLSLIAIFTRL